MEAIPTKRATAEKTVYLERDDVCARIKVCYSSLNLTKLPLLGCYIRRDGFCRAKGLRALSAFG